MLGVRGLRAEAHMSEVMLNVCDAARSVHRKSGVVVLEDAPPQVAHQVAASEAAHLRAARRTLVIRHASGHRVVALLGIVSPANKDRPRSVADFVDKAVAAVRQGIHVLVVDLFAPGPHDPHGLHSLIWEDYGDKLDAPPCDKPSHVGVVPGQDAAGGLSGVRTTGRTAPADALVH